jgi:hypothetical protein
VQDMILGGWGKSNFLLKFGELDFLAVSLQRN